MSQSAARPSRLFSLPWRVVPCVALVVSLSVPAHAQGAACGDARIRIEGPLEGRWARAVLALCESLHELPDLDPQIVIRVISSQPDVILEASLPDGRTALRRIRAPADLRPTLEALATVPPEPASAPEPPSAPSPVAPATPPASSAAAALRPRSAAAAAPQHPAPSLGFELGASADFRMEGSPTYASAGPAAYVGIRPGPWMVALILRWQVAQTVLRQPPRGFEMSTFGFGFATTRRFALAPAVHLDLGLSAMLLAQGQEYLPGRGDDENENEEDERSRAPRSMPGWVRYSG